MLLSLDIQHRLPQMQQEKQPEDIAYLDVNLSKGQETDEAEAWCLQALSEHIAWLYVVKDILQACRYCSRKPANTKGIGQSRRLQKLVNQSATKL